MFPFTVRVYTPTITLLTAAAAVVLVTCFIRTRILFVNNTRYTEKTTNTEGKKKP